MATPGLQSVRQQQDPSGGEDLSLRASLSLRSNQADRPRQVFQERHGWLLKRGRYNRQYKRRYFHLVLMDPKLLSIGSSAASPPLEEATGSSASPQKDWDSTTSQADFDSFDSAPRNSLAGLVPVLRYFVARESFQRGDAPKGSIIISAQVLAEKYSRNDGTRHKFRLVTSKRTWTYAADGAEECDAWISECQYIDGVICKKNVAHRKMRQHIMQPRILLLSGALDFARAGQRLTSLETLRDQEDMHVALLVAKVMALQPDVLFVGRSVSRKAQEQLLEAGVTLVLNVEPTQLSRIARLTGALMLASIDHADKVPAKAVIGTCSRFTTRNLEGAGTHIVLEGCDRRLGCTLLLRGADARSLSLVKEALECSLFEAYTRRLELA
eukprot:g6463.t1